MTPEEYKQLKAFARQDGALLSLIWIAAFVCYLQGLTNPLLGMAAVVLALWSPFYAAGRLRSFRDNARDGVITFGRGYAFTVLTFFYAGLLLAVALFVYFTFIDDGYLIGQFMKVVNSEEGRQVMKIYGVHDEVNESLKAFSEMRPIDNALNMLTINISMGFLLGLPIAAVMRREVRG